MKSRLTQTRTRISRWRDAQAYAKWLSEQTGQGYRLPSEVEWEYAARAGTDTRYWWGNEIRQDGKVWANCDGCGSQWDNKQTAPIASFAANAFGLHDTSGNVWEWVQDCWHDDTEALPMTALRGCLAIVLAGCCAAARGTADRGSCVPPPATGTGPRTATSAGVFGSPGRFSFFLCNYSDRPKKPRF